MLFLLNGQGVLQRLDNDRIFRGSNNFTKLGVIYPYDTVALAAIFTLPNGLATKAFPMSIPRVYTLTNAQTGQTKTFENLYYYETEITSDVTALEGVAKVTIAQMSQAGLDKEGEPVYSTVGTSYSASFTIEYAPYPDYTPVATPTTDDYNQLVQVLVTYQNMLNADLNALESTKQDKTDPALLTEDKTVVGAINELLDEVTGGEAGGGLTERVTVLEAKTDEPLMTDFNVQGNTAKIDFNDGSNKEVQLPGGTSATRPWIRYSTSSDGNPMTEDPDEGASVKYVGFFVGLNPSNDPADYKWSRYSGKGIEDVMLQGFTFVITYEGGETEEVPIDSEDAMVVRETFDDIVYSFNGETGAVTGVSSFNGETGAVEGVSSFNGETGDINFDTVERAETVKLPNGAYAAIQAAILEIAYPVGSIKITTNSANPSTYLGGAWAAWGSGRVPVGINASDTDFATAEATGGSKDAVVVQHTHTQQQHNHDLWNANLGEYSGSIPVGRFSFTKNRNRTLTATGGAGDWFENQYYDTIHTAVTTPTINSAGESGEGKNLQPYIVCYMWKRLA